MAYLSQKITFVKTVGHQTTTMMTLAPKKKKQKEAVKPGGFFSKSKPIEGLFFQPKLTIGPTDDVYEREADAAADKVMRMEDSGQIQPKISPIRIQRMCPTCEEEEKAQRKEKERNGGSIEAPSIVSETVRSGGKPLEKNTRSFMESRMGMDFSNVKIHTGSVAAKSAQSINALAYTSGNSIVFNEGQYSPGTDSGKRLLAHELTHVIQQNASVLSKRIQRQTDAGFESLSGVDTGIANGTLTADTIMGQTYTASCGSYAISFKFSKAYKGDYPYQSVGRDVRGVYIKVEMTYTDNRYNGRCTPMRIIQVLRNIKKGTSGSIELADPGNATRRERSGLGNASAPSRGWRVDTTTSSTDPYVTDLTYHANEGSETAPGILWDAPGHWTTTTNHGKEFNSCAVCQDASNRRWVTGCVNWGYYTDSSGSIAFRPPTPVASCSSTQQLQDASTRWDAISGNTDTG